VANRERCEPYRVNPQKRTGNGQITMFCKPTTLAHPTAARMAKAPGRARAYCACATAATVAAALLLAAPTVAAACWEEAGARHGIDPDLLRAIAWHESRGWTNAVGPRLPDGNRALGLMQINTVHLPNLQQYGVRKEDLFDGCASAQLGAWVLADCITKLGATWRAVGCYYTGPNSKNTAAQLDYVRAVRANYDGYKRQSAAGAALAPPAGGRGG